MRCHTSVVIVALLISVSCSAAPVELLVGGNLVRLTDPLPCRLEAGGQAGLVHAQVGVSSHAVCDSYFDAATDTAFTVTGPADAQGRLPAQATPNFMKDKRGLKYFKAIDKSVFETPPSGWCSWYYYYRGLDEAESVKNLDWIAENLGPFGATYFQIDDIWQLQGDKDSRWWRDWEGVYKDRFPHGMKWLADQIHAKGMKAGIWLACYGQTNSEFVKANPELWLKDKAGDYVDAGWVGRYLADTSSKAGQQYMHGLFKRLSEEWGYDYFKIDGQPVVVNIYRKHRDTLRDPSAGPDSAYRKGLEAIREAIGPQRFLLGCWGIPTEGIGIMNGSRTGGDVAANWRGFQPAINCTMRWYFTHNTAWYADPDTVLVRPPLTLDQARAWASLYGITGQLLMASDKMYELPPDRVEVLKRIYPPADIKPMCLYPYEGRPRIWHLVARVPGIQRDVVSVFNWDDQQRPVSIGFSDIDPAFAGKDIAVYDFWEKRYLGRFRDSVTLAQRPTSCDVLSVCPVAQTPQLISTSRHITQGALELEQAEWEDSQQSWSGASQLVGGDEYTLTFLLDTTRGDVWQATEVSTSGPEATVRNDWPLAHVTFTAPESATVTWRVDFAGANRPAPLNLTVPADLSATSDHWRRVNLSWEAVDGASGYRVSRDNKPLGILLTKSYVDRAVEPATTYTYTVQAYGPRGETSKVSQPVAVRTLDPPQRPPKPEVHITDLKPVSVKQGWGTTRFDKSAENNTLRIGEESFERGIGTHAASEIIYDIAGKGFSTFVSLVGIDREISAPQGTCAFLVYVDGKKRFDSDVIGAKDEALGVKVDVTGAKELKLVVTDGGDNIDYDHADWAEAGFLR